MKYNNYLSENFAKILNNNANILKQILKYQLNNNINIQKNFNINNIYQYILDNDP